MKGINLMTLKEIKEKFSIQQMLELIVKYTKESEKYRVAMMHAKSQLQYSMNECFYQIAKTKISKLQSLAY